MKESFNSDDMRPRQERYTEPSPELDKLAHDVIGAALEVHRILGPGYLESVYEEALCIELDLRGIRFERQVCFSVEYKAKTIGEGRIDILIDKRLVVELKAVEVHNSLYEAQVLSYLKAVSAQLGLLINFNVPLLKNGMKRLVLS